MEFKPYFSIDVETTGLDPVRNQLLQVAIVCETWKGAVEDLPYLNLIIDNGTGSSEVYGDLFAIHMNMWILKAILDHREGLETDIPVVCLEEAIEKFNRFIHYLVKPKERIYVGGKNIASFDIPFLRANGFPVDIFKHRTVDPGPMYLPDFGYIPSMGEIAAKLKLPPVSHDALDDARQVIKMVRHKTHSTTIS